MNGIGAYLESKGVRVSTRSGWQAVKCPFHGDSDASASLNLDKGKFHCFVCLVHEDLIGLLRTQEGMTYEEAKREAENKYGAARVEVAREPRASRSALFDGQGGRSKGGAEVSSRRSLG